MLGVVDDGFTAAGARIPGVKVAGKTGTAEVGGAVSNSLFIGFAPYDSPTLAVSICLEGNGSDIEGSAARMGGSIIRQCLAVQAQGATT